MAARKYSPDVVDDVGRQGSGRIKFKENSSFIICGRSGSGKTTFIFKLLLHRKDVFQNKSGRRLQVVYCFSTYQPLFDELKEEIPDIIFHQGIPDEDFLGRILSPEKKHVILVVDDLMRQVVSSSLIFDFFTVRAHHEGASIIYVSHNLFQQGKYSRAITLNASYICLFQNPRGADQIQTLSRQIFPGKSHALAKAYNMAIAVQDYGYLIVDMTANVPEELRLRTKIFPDEITRFYTFA